MRVIGYMVTWTTYGTWLQGDKRGWVKDGETYKGHIALEDFNRRQMNSRPVILTKEQQNIAAKAVLEKAEELKQKIFALAICDNHVHLVVNNIPLPIGRVVSHYKNAIRLAFEDESFEGKCWTKGFDKRYCMNEEETAAKIAYVRGHAKTGSIVIF